MSVLSIFQKVNNGFHSLSSENEPMSRSPDGPSNHKFFSPEASAVVSRVVSSTGLDKAYKSLRFSESSRVMSIPSRHECLAPGMDLWWSSMDYHGFKQTRIQESKAGLDKASFNFQKAQDSDVLVDMCILVVSDRNVISSHLTSNLAVALSAYEEEINTDAVGAPVFPHRRVRSSVTQASINSKEYALAVQGPLSKLLHNVIVYDTGKRHAQEQMTRQSFDEDVREHKQATSYMDSQPDSYIVGSERGSSLCDDGDLSPLLLADSFDASQVRYNENFLLRKIIRSGSALCYLWDPHLPDPDEDSALNFSEDMSPRRRRRRQGSSLPPCIPIPRECSTVYPPMRRSSAPACLISSQQTYSLLKDHADVVVEQNFPAEEVEASSCVSATTASSAKSCEAEGVLSVDDWLSLFRITTSRVASIPHTPPPPVPKKANRRVSLGLVTSRELDVIPESTSSGLVSPPEGEEEDEEEEDEEEGREEEEVLHRSSGGGGESLLALSLRGINYNQ
mmetsp:Transcript_25802/g.43510  ORF Transcript_25802/g.43510 Transcript_25802/m.43510 type:complete len:506 (-) Transcript_25802:365-1882(-)|eukprot:CAMPEP_0114447652 /NCGR_PEP_ID=MMETSP0103-20121206/19893_1 /TAXON_ID=37642 ORGANISM="Paraphysomonas imperforata, Strain PA2" /NCGR_SAMPLE_ID=MMETSP0103 /ASSEMBLY_ACC=CAM_ASM_000201 /LENGTH=505 /DNA_ID=CAMNT_0001619589 /DNA_START=83 /DNA_END=1600 /DNA_ORIENTATION=+